MVMSDCDDIDDSGGEELLLPEDLGDDFAAQFAALQAAEAAANAEAKQRRAAKKKQKSRAAQLSLNAESSSVVVLGS